VITPKVLIADDNIENRYMLETLFNNNGYETISAANGQEALNLAAEHGPDLIITDILMPVMDGYALCRQCKADERLKRIPFVFYTATYTDERDAEFGLSLGANRYLIKPQEPLMILQIIKEVLAEAELDPNLRKSDSLGEEMEFLRHHNEVLFRKLEKKMVDLMDTNVVLQREIKERQHAETALRESEKKLKALLDCSPVGIIWAARDSIREQKVCGTVRLYGHRSAHLQGFFPACLSGYI
jgi:CheY-like chemotaxis protein